MEIERVQPGVVRLGLARALPNAEHTTELEMNGRLCTSPATVVMEKEIVTAVRVPLRHPCFEILPCLLMEKCRSLAHGFVRQSDQDGLHLKVDVLNSQITDLPQTQASFFTDREAHAIVSS